MSSDAARPPREKRRNGWFEDFEVTKVAKKQSPTLRGQPGLPPRLPGGPSAPPGSDLAHRGSRSTEVDSNPDDSAAYCNSRTAFVQQGSHDERPSANRACRPGVLTAHEHIWESVWAQALFDEAALEAQLDRTPGLAGLVELATTPVGTPNVLVGNPGKVGHAPPALDLLADPVAEGEKRVTIWNPFEKRKLSGNSAPFKKNLEEYLKKHPDWEEYWGQDLDEHGRKLFPRKRRRTSAEPSPALTGKSGPAGTSMMDGLLQLASEEQGLGEGTMVAAGGISLGSLGSRVQQDHKLSQKQAPTFSSSLQGVSSVLDSVQSKGDHAAASSRASGEKTALSMVQGVVTDAIEDSVKMQRQALPQLTPTPTALTTMGSATMPSVKSC